MLKRSQEEKLAKLTPAAQKIELDRIELEAIAHFQRQLDDLESALEMLRMGHWQAPRVTD
jgi:hypothetical protein